MAFNQRLSAEIEPTGSPTWKAATDADRLAFYREAATRAVTLKRAELAKAIGGDGKRMRARKHPRADGANGPVMTPHDAASRTDRLMAGHADPRGMTLFWRSGHSRAQRLPWGTILGFHARGEVRGAPIRDVRLSPGGVGKLKAGMAEWWEDYSRRSGIKARADRARARSEPEKPGLIRRLQKALIARYSGLKDYLRDPKDGF